MKPTPESEQKWTQIETTQTTESCRSRTHKQDYGVLQKIVYTTRTSSTPAQQPKRSSPGAAAAVPPEGTISPRKCTQSCLASFICNTRTCSNDDHAAPSPRSGPAPAQRRRSTTRYCTEDWMTSKTSKSEKRTQHYRKNRTQRKNSTQNCQTTPHERRTTEKTETDGLHTLHKYGRPALTQACFHEHPSKAQGPRCTSAARRANHCKSAPASCRHPGPRTR